MAVVLVASWWWWVLAGCLSQLPVAAMCSVLALGWALLCALQLHAYIDYDVQMQAFGYK